MEVDLIRSQVDDAWLKDVGKVEGLEDSSDSRTVEDSRFAFAVVDQVSDAYQSLRLEEVVGADYLL